MKTYFFNFILVLIAVCFFGTLISCEQKSNVVRPFKAAKKDSVVFWINQSKSNKLTLEERKGALNYAYKAVGAKLTDSIRLNYFSKIAIEAENLNSDDLFKKVNFQNLELAQKLDNKSKIGDAHWNYGSYFSEKEIIDSAYYHFHQAYENFKFIKNEKYTAKMLYNMGYIQGRIKDYTGSEISLIDAIAIYKKLNRYKNLYQCYNYLGLIYMELEEYDKAIYYHNEALKYLEKVEDKGFYKEGSLSNLGLVYQKKQEYGSAIKYFTRAIQDNNLKGRSISLYARLIDNISYTKYLSGDTINVEKGLEFSYRIRDSLKDVSGVVMSKRHLSEFKAFQFDTLSAVKLAKNAYNLAGHVDNNRDKLATLLLLSKVDEKNSKDYLKEYVHLNDSLQIADRKTRNKFTRIKFETDEYIEETEKLSQQNIFIIIGSILSILLILFAYLMRVQRSRNKELLFEKEQQKSNEEIFSLMIKQQSKLEEGRLKERHRISEDLHDGVLGKIFGTRLGLGFLDIKGNEETVAKHKLYIEELQNIEKEIRTISHELKNELLSSKENFSKIIEDLIEKKSKLGRFHFDYINSNQIDWDSINDGIKIHIYRIIQEALQNVIKYANANKVKIEIGIENENLKLSITDNGMGFDVHEKRKGIGLKNMTSRAEKINGIFRVNSVIGEGTAIEITCPLNENYE